MNPITIAILVVGIVFTALYGWLNRYEFYTNHYKDYSLTKRYNIFTDTTCDLIPAKPIKKGLMRSYEYEELWEKEELDRICTTND